jgi:hypothetical protein
MTDCDHRWVTKNGVTGCEACGEAAPKNGYAPRHLVPGTSTQVDVESEILRLSARLEEATDDLARLLVAEAEAEVQHKREWATSTLKSNEGTVAQREAHATLQTVDALVQRKITAALASAQKELCHSLRAQLSALQTLAANIRAQV